MTTDKKNLSVKFDDSRLQWSFLYMKQNLKFITYFTLKKFYYINH